MCYNKNAKRDIPTEIETALRLGISNSSKYIENPQRVSTRRYTPMRTHN